VRSSVEMSYEAQLIVWDTLPRVRIAPKASMGRVRSRLGSLSSGRWADG
jgi:hypothetical protein